MEQKKKKKNDDLQRLHDELLSEKKKVADIFEHAPAFMAILRGENHIFEMANSSYYQLVGHRDILGKSVQEALPEVVEQGFIKILDSVLQTGNRFVGKEIHVTLNREKDSLPEERFIDFVYEPITDSTGKRTGILVHGYDITEQVLMRRKVEESEIQYRTLFNAIDEGFCVVEILFDEKRTPIDYRVIETNPVFEQQTGLVNAIGKTAREMNLEKHWIETYGNVSLTGKSIRFTQGSDQLGRWFDVFATRVGGPESPKVVIIFADITKRRELERQKDDFMGIVSHELKTPVTSIKAFTQVLQNRFMRAGDERSSMLLGKMDVQINKLTTLIGDLLDVTRIEAGKFQFNEDYFDFDTLVKEVIEEVQRTTDKHSIIYKDGAKETIYGDKDRIGQVIINFLTNAMKYSPLADNVVVKTTSDKKSVTLCVQDFGVGIPKRKQSQIFQRFYRVSGETHDTVPGIGLGLYISSEIVKRQNGTIWFESTQGKGSTFCFRLPLRKGEKSSAKEKPKRE